MTQDELTITQRINQEIKDVLENRGEISDGYHTFNELYEHRIVLFIALCKCLEMHPPPGLNIQGVSVWRSQLHSDGTMFKDYFVMGIMVDGRSELTITYHLKMKDWDKTYFANTVYQAPEWDGHTSDDVLKRLTDLLDWI